MKITKEELTELVNQKLTQRQIAEHFDCSQGRIKYQLKKHGLKTYRGPHNKLPFEGRLCGVCGTQDSSKFYGRMRHKCGPCHNEYTIQRGRNNKLKGIEYLGGSCQICGFTGFPAAFDFHHLDPNKKDVNFSSHKTWSWDKLKKELDGCALLCANCHRGVHSGDLDL